MEQAELITKLKTISLFKNLDDAFYDKFLKIISVEKFSEKSSIINEGDSGRDMYILIKGTVRVNKKTVSGETYTAALLSDDKSIIFGEIGLLAEDKRSATVLAETKCVIGLLNADKFNEFLDEYPVYGVKLLKELSALICQKMKKSNQDMLIFYEALIGEIGQSYL